MELCTTWLQGNFVSNDFAGIQGVSESSTSSQQDQDNQDCIAMPIWKDASYFDDASPRSVADAQIQDQNGTHDDCSLQNNGTADQQVNTASPDANTGSREVSTAIPEVNTATPEDLMGPIPTSEDTQVEDQEIELGNISPSYEVSSTPHTRIHKDHPIDHVIGDVQSSVQTRRMTTSYSELGFLGAIYEGKTHQDLHTCLFACFLSQEEPKRVSKALSDPAWVEAMQEELLQFKLQKDLLKKRALTIDEVLHHVAELRGNKNIPGYASYMGLTVYQMDVPKVLSVLTEKDRYMIGSLMYRTTSQTSIMFAVCAVQVDYGWSYTDRSQPLEGAVFWENRLDFLAMQETNDTKNGIGPEQMATLDDHDGVTSLPNSEIFKQLALMGYHTDSDKLTFQKGAFSPQWRFLIHCILHCISPKKSAWEQFSSNIATAVICLATNRKKCEVSTAGAKQGTASEKVLIVSTVEVNLSTAGQTVTYTRRSAEKRSRQDKGKAIMIESEPKKKSKKELDKTD
ncbi:hypothetical protein Tco_1082750 [Tanacetum coccineum]|uniref:Reverse transcriptase Ty1/copia-type domain-containing protein n=1 Tax=Tanacetum coccineum TaxID=301880 RepID=A0ABQ5I1J3_9ASTR